MENILLTLLPITVELCKLCSIIMNTGDFFCKTTVTLIDTGKPEESPLLFSITVFKINVVNKSFLITIMLSRHTLY